MCGLPAVTDPNVLVGYATGDDCGVYRLSDELAIVQTLDVLTPIVDEPRLFGRIAAANSLSDVYAMGGQPRVAVNFLALPPDEGDLEVAREILAGGCDALEEAGVALLGGHTIEDAELKFGLCVVGTVHPDRILTNAGVQPGDSLVLTKPLGTGVVATAIKAGLASASDAAAASASMARLNAAAARAAVACGAHACTDVTGFGLVGHLLEMAAASGVAPIVDAARVPLLPGALDYCAMGLRTAAAERSRRFYACKVDEGGELDAILLDLLYDPQTSGGLLIAAPDADALLDRLHADGVAEAAAIGRVDAEPPGRVRIV